MNSSYYRIMALDYGDVRIGIALTDVTRTIASPYQTYTRVSFHKDIDYLSQLIKEKDARVVVFGLPLNMDGSSGIRVQKTQEFANALAKRIDARIEYVDERLSSVSAEKVLLDADMSRAKRKQVIDKLAAQIILQEYLETKGE